MSEHVRVLIVDDHPVVRAGLRGMLESQQCLEVVGEAEDGEEAVKLTEQLSPNVVLMDLRMPGMSGVAATAQIKERMTHANVLVLSTYDSSADILRAIEAVENGKRQAKGDELFRAIRAAAQGKPLLAPEVAAHLMERVRWPSEEVLSGREIEVLELVAQGKGNRDIAGELWISEATVKSHLLRIYDKLGAADRASAVAAAMKRGILR